eukprot:GEMP01049146.1.p1 GENE.GEMP01049146.1~~GEMP01049146.1.p1  ORF type:complete len:230 (+),score=23.34 GEMP01049146.1:37-726(+)
MPGSIAGTVAQHVAGNMADKMQSGITSFGKSRVGEEFSSPLSSEINWHDYNYPPCLRVIHYELGELPEGIRKKVSHMNSSLKITFFALLLNVLNSIIFTIASKAPTSWIFYSTVHTLFLSIIALFVFYQGYRGLSSGDKSLLRQYKMLQAMLLVVYVMLMVVGSGPINGFLKLGKIRNYVDPTVAIYEYWLTMVIIESSLWIINIFMAIATILHAHNFDDSQLSFGTSV